MYMKYLTANIFYKFVLIEILLVFNFMSLICPIFRYIYYSIAEYCATYIQIIKLCCHLSVLKHKI